MDMGPMMFQHGWLVFWAPVVIQGNFLFDGEERTFLRYEVAECYLAPCW